MPNILRHITLVDYTKCDLVEWFWERLYCSLCEPIQTNFEMANPQCINQENKMLNFHELSENEINMDIPEEYMKGRPKAPVPMTKLNEQPPGTQPSRQSSQTSETVQDF